MYLGDYVTLEQGTGIVHSAPAYGIEDFNSCRAYGLQDDDILTPVEGNGRYAESLPLFGGLKIMRSISRRAADPECVPRWATRIGSGAIGAAGMVYLVAALR